MTVRTDPKTHTGELISLGPIQAKLSAIPDWEYIFRSAEDAQTNHDVKPANRIGGIGS